MSPVKISCLNEYEADHLWNETQHECLPDLQHTVNTVLM